MHKILRAAVFGLATGTALFFVPFIFRFVLFALLAGFIFRTVFRRRHIYYTPHWHRHYGYNSYQPYENEAIPIDGKWAYRSGMQQDGAESNIPLSQSPKK